MSHMLQTSFSLKKQEVVLSRTKYRRYGQVQVLDVVPSRPMSYHDVQDDILSATAVIYEQDIVPNMRRNTDSSESGGEPDPEG